MRLVLSAWACTVSGASATIMASAKGSRAH
jgi:hypothetical protein